MKTNKFMRIASVLLVAVVLTTCAISGTFAKYTSETTGTDTARVAKWDFTVNTNGTPSSSTFTFDLFKTITDNDGTTAETDLSATDGSIIAPGTSGKFDIVLTNKSEVTAKYAIDYTVTKSDATLPILFSVDGTTWTSDLADVAASEEETTSTKLAYSDGTKTITVQWKWAFDGNDTTDTTLGIAGTATVKVDAKVTVTQVD